MTKICKRVKIRPSYAEFQRVLKSGHALYTDMASCSKCRPCMFFLNNRFQL